MRISAISYLNTAPLMWDFEHGPPNPSFEISYTVPSQCAAELARSAADIGIIPSAAYATIPGLVILPDVAIAATRAVRSILLVSRKPIDHIRSIALDSSSLTSVALLKILFKKFWQTEPVFDSTPPNLEPMLSQHDAALLIGDPALQVDRSKYLTWDLAEEWIHLTGKPFVFAFWAITGQAALRAPAGLAQIFQRSRDHGLQSDNLAAISQTWSRHLGLTPESVLEYLTQNIHYHLDTPCLDGLQLFYRYAHECKLIPHLPELHFAEARPTLT
jgi:chorismate dehydratase